MTKKGLKPMQIVQRNLLVLIASNILGLNPVDISGIFGISRQTVYDISKGTELSKLKIIKKRK